MPFPVRIGGLGRLRLGLGRRDRRYADRLGIAAEPCHPAGIVGGVLRVGVVADVAIFERLGDTVAGQVLRQSRAVAAWGSGETHGGFMSVTETEAVWVIAAMTGALLW